MKKGLKRLANRMIGFGVSAFIVVGLWFVGDLYGLGGLLAIAIWWWLAKRFDIKLFDED